MLSELDINFDFEGDDEEYDMMDFEEEVLTYKRYRKKG
jgi:hypothetical protein